MMDRVYISCLASASYSMYSEGVKGESLAT